MIHVVGGWLGREEQAMKGGAGVCSAHRAHLPAGKLVNNAPPMNTVGSFPSSILFHIY